MLWSINYSMECMLSAGYVLDVIHVLICYSVWVCGMVYSVMVWTLL